MAPFSLTSSAHRIWRAYEHQLARRPVATQMTTSALLWGLGDVLAQRLAEQRPVLDRHRVAMTAAFGAAFMGPVGHYWYLGLDHVVANSFRAGSVGFTAAKVIADSMILGPIYVLAFYAWGAFFIDRSGADGFKEKIAKDFVPTYIAEMCFWPAVQTVNFTRIPVAHQLLVVNCLTLVDASFLSWARCQEDWVATLATAVGMSAALAKARGLPDIAVVAGKS